MLCPEKGTLSDFLSECRFKPRCGSLRSPFSGYAQPMETVVARVSEEVCLELLDVVLDTIHFKADLQRYDSPAD